MGEEITISIQHLNWKRPSSAPNCCVVLQSKLKILALQVGDNPCKIGVHGAGGMGEEGCEEGRGLEGLAANMLRKMLRGIALSFR